MTTGGGAPTYAIFSNIILVPREDFASPRNYCPSPISCNPLSICWWPERASFRDPHPLWKSLWGKTCPEARSSATPGGSGTPGGSACGRQRRRRRRDAVGGSGIGLSALLVTGLTADGSQWKRTGRGLGCRHLLCWHCGVLHTPRTRACRRGFRLILESQPFGFSDLKSASV